MFFANQNVYIVASDIHNYELQHIILNLNLILSSINEFYNLKYN